MSEEIQGFDNFDDLYIAAVKRVAFDYDYIVEPRGLKCKEILNSKCVLYDPTKSLVTLEDRKLNYAFAIVEKLQYLSGNTDADRLIYYNSNFSNWRNKYGYFDGDYAKRVSYWLEHIYFLLKTDPDTRQAVLPIYGIQDRHESKDIPCTIFLHFFIRDNRLYLTVYMRSNDLLWGTPYDINAFCFIQQFLASCLGIGLGSYTHLVGSLHIYSDTEEKLLKIIGSKKLDVSNPLIEKPINFHEYLSKINLFFEAERRLRKGEEYGSLIVSLPESLKFSFNILKDYVERKTKNLNN